MWEIFLQGHILSTIGDALQEELVGDVSSSSLAFGCVGGGVGSPHWVQRKKGVMGSYGDGHHITESTHSWSSLEVLKSAQGLAKKLLGVFFAFFCFSDLGDDAFLGSAVLYSKEFRDESLEALKGWWLIAMFVKRSGRKEAFEMGFGFERFWFFLEGCAGINIRLGRKTLQKEVWKMLSWMINQSWSLAGLCSSVSPEPSVPGSTGGSKAAWEPLASLQTHYVRVTSVASFMWPDCKQPVRSISSSSSTQNLLRRRFSSTSRCSTFLLTASNCRKLHNKFHHSNLVRSDVFEQVSRIPRNSQAHYSLKKIVETRSMASSSSSPLFQHKFLLFVQTEKMMDIISISLDALRLHYY